VVAVSAMGKATDQLVALARQVSRNPHGRDYDLLLASGEQVAVATLALALQDKGVPAIALTGAQCNTRTDGSFNRARIQSIDTARIEEELHKGRVVIVAGFQGVTENDEVTTLGRGGGDITGGRGGRHPRRGGGGGAQCVRLRDLHRRGRRVVCGSERRAGCEVLARDHL